MYVLGDNSVFNQALEAKIEQRAATVDEEVEIWKYEKKIEKYDGNKVISKDEIIESQLNRGLLTQEEVKEAREMGNVVV